MAVEQVHPAAPGGASCSRFPTLSPYSRYVRAVGTRFAICASIAFGLTNAANVAALDTTFTYQGELEVSGAPADGVFDIEFVMFAVEDGGSAIVTHRSEDLDIHGGLFTTEIDFTAVPFAMGHQYWMELRVRPGSSTGGFQQLLPRQKITPAPYAIAARYVVGTGGVQQQALAVGAVGTQSPLLGDGRSVSPVRIASGGITGSHLAANAITADKVRDEAGLQSGSGPFVFLTSTPAPVAQVTINVPAAGRVLLIGHMTLAFQRNASTPAQSVYMLLSDAPDATAGNESVRVPAGTPGSDTRSATVSRDYIVAAGTQTFYLNAREGTSTGTVQAKYSTIRAIYFPTSY